MGQEEIKPAKVTVSVPLTVEQTELLDSLAFAQGMSRAAYIRFLLLRHFELLGINLQKTRAPSQNVSHIRT